MDVQSSGYGELRGRALKVDAIILGVVPLLQKSRKTWKEEWLWIPMDLGDEGKEGNK